MGAGGCLWDDPGLEVFVVDGHGVGEVGVGFACVVDIGVSCCSLSAGELDLFIFSSLQYICCVCIGLTVNVAVFLSLSWWAFLSNNTPVKQHSPIINIIVDRLGPLVISLPAIYTPVHIVQCLG